MRRLLVPTLLLSIAFLGACSRRDRDSDFNSDRDHNSAARALGKAAYDLKRESAKLAKKAGQELRTASHEAHQGWQEEKAKKQRTDRDR